MNIVTKKVFMLLMMISPAVENKMGQEENWIRELDGRASAPARVLRRTWAGGCVRAGLF